MKNREMFNVHTHGLDKCEDGVWREPADFFSKEEIPEDVLAELKQKRAHWQRKRENADKSKRVTDVMRCDNRLAQIDAQLIDMFSYNPNAAYMLH